MIYVAGLNAQTHTSVLLVSLEIKTHGLHKRKQNENLQTPAPSKNDISPHILPLLLLFILKCQSL